MKLVDFDIYANLLKEKSGLNLTQDKCYLIESRLNPIAKKWGYENVNTMTVALQIIPDPKLVNDIVEAMTTNETSFFRDTRPFDTFRDVVLKYIKENRKKKHMRIWCAASSSGQEPYTLAMILSEIKDQFPGWKFEIVATDISRQILDTARKGIYSQFEVQRGMPITLLVKYFNQVEEKWHLNDSIKSMVKFDYFNLLSPMHALGIFDVIFCRNVLIYFDQETKSDVLGRMHNQLENDGFLFLGGAETVLGITDSFKGVPEQRGLYALSDGPHFSSSTRGSAQALA